VFANQHRSPLKQIIMATKQKSPKNRFAEKDRADNQKFLLIVIGATALLMVLMYFIFV
jgi:hypothetical protein